MVTTMSFRRRTFAISRQLLDAPPTRAHSAILSLVRAGLTRRQPGGPELYRLTPNRPLNCPNQIAETRPG